MKDIVWDNQCYSCSNSLCEKLTATNIYDTSKTVSYKNCRTEEVKDSSKFFDHDAKFYVTWFGTDKDNRQLKSSNLAMSKFKQYSVSDLYKSVKTSVSVDSKKIKEADVKEKIEELAKEWGKNDL